MGNHYYQSFLVRKHVYKTHTPYVGPVSTNQKDRKLDVSDCKLYKEPLYGTVIHVYDLKEKLQRDIITT